MPRGLAPRTLFLAVLMTACGEVPTDQSASLEPSVALLQVIGGDAQVGIVGEELPDPLIVRALDARGMPVRRQVVNFVVTKGGGHVYAGAALTDNHGYASDYWTLGPSLEVGANRLEVRAVDPVTHTKQMFASFEATGIEGPPPGDPIAEVCDGTDTSGNGLIDDGLPYCFNGEPAPNTDGAVCLDGYYDMDGIAETGCESDSPEFSICHSTLEFDSPDLPLGWSATMDGVEEGIDASLFGALSGDFSSLNLRIQAWGGVILSNEGAVSPGVEALTIAWTQDHLQIAEFYETRFTAGDPENGQPWWRVSLTRSDDWVDRYRLEIGDGTGAVATTEFTELPGFWEGTLTHTFTVREGELHIEARDGVGQPLAEWTQALPGFQPLQGSHWSFEARSWEGGDDGGFGDDVLRVVDFSSRCAL